MSLASGKGSSNASVLRLGALTGLLSITRAASDVISPLITPGERSSETTECCVWPIIYGPRGKDFELHSLQQNLQRHDFQVFRCLMDVLSSIRWTLVACMFVP